MRQSADANNVDKGKRFETKYRSLRRPLWQFSPAMFVAIALDGECDLDCQWMSDQTKGPSHTDGSTPQPVSPSHLFGNL
jgi:inhibitor of KinA sporulation pathway (predicted exonuclease)